MNEEQIKEQAKKMAEAVSKIAIDCKDFCGYPYVAAAGWDAPNEAALSNKEQIEEIQKTIGNVTVHNTTYAKVANSAFIHKIAEAVYNAGYRKVPKDSIVLSKEEYDEIKTYQSYIPEMKKAFDKIRNATSKETAEKILLPLYDACKEDSYGQVVVDFTILENLAKQFGVEIQE